MAKQDNSKAGGKPTARRGAAKSAAIRANGVLCRTAVRRTGDPNTGLDSTPSRPAAGKTGIAPLGALVNRRAADRLRDGHLWVYASDIVSVALRIPGRSPRADARGRHRAAVSRHGAL